MYTKILVISIALFLTGNLVFFWLNTIIDSYFYWAFAQYIKTGNYPFQAPFVYSKPTKISPPLYAVLLLAIENLPSPTLALRIAQTLLFAWTCLLVYKILSQSHSQKIASIGTLCFAILPANVIYINYMLTEIAAQWFVALITYMLLSASSKQKTTAIVVGACSVLLKYSLVVYPFVAGIWIFLKKPKKIINRYSMLALAILGSWVFINWQITGTIGLSDSKNIQLYNQLVWVGKITPDERSKSMQQLRAYIPSSVDIKQAYWDLQPYILPHFKQSWQAVETILGNVAKDALKQHPLGYFKNTMHIFFRLHGNSLPYWSNLTTTTFCGNLGRFLTCQPFFPLPAQRLMWQIFIQSSDLFYTHVFPIISYGIFFPSVILGLRSKHKYWKKIIALYLAGVVPIAMYVHPDTRYIIPFYPLFIVICVFGVNFFGQQINFARHMVAKKKADEDRSEAKNTRKTTTLLSYTAKNVLHMLPL